MTVYVKDIVAKIEAMAPKYLAMQGDPVGLQIGDLAAPVKKVMVTLDVRPEVVQEAIDKNIDFIFAHHPVMFRPAKNLDFANPQNKMYADLIKNSITVYAAHTNLDKTQGGMNDWLSEAIGLTDVEAFDIQESVQLLKLVVFVPVSHGEIMRQALQSAGAGQVGNHLGASFTSLGQGRFTPENGANPIIGTIGGNEVVDEERIECIFSQAQRSTILAAMLAAHPYEIPAYDLYNLVNSGDPIGIGRMGKPHQEMSILNYAKYLKQVLNVGGVRLITHNPEKTVKKVAIVGGDGGKFFQAAVAAKVDVFITGDVYYHIGHDMLAAGLSVVDPGHHIESIVKPKMTAQIKNWAASAQWPITVEPSELNTDPFTFI